MVSSICITMMKMRLFATFYSIFLFSSVLSQNFEPFAKEVGGTFCRYLAYQSILPRKYFSDCGEQACIWDEWYNSVYGHQSGAPSSKRIVVSYAHNGFGNQLWEHSVAFMIAESLKAQMYIAVIPDNLSPDGFSPPNTWSGMAAMERMLPKEFQYEYLPADSPVRKLCDNEQFYLSDRPFDKRNKNYSENFRSNVYSILTDKNPRCVKFLGYFQSLPLCAEDARRLWTPRLVANFTVKPGPNDVSIYLRCVPRHYHFNDQKFYETILNHISFDRVWLFQAPECPTKLSDNPAKDGLVAGVVRLLISKYNATRWPQYQGTDETSFLLHDLAGLAQSKKLILPLSSWAFWAGFLSNATEIHVNAPPHHANMGAAYPQYIYHNDKTQQYFGRFDSKEGDIVYDNKYLLQSHTTSATAASSSNNSSIAAGAGEAASAGAGGGGATATTEPVAVAKETTPYTVHFDIV